MYRLNCVAKCRIFSSSVAASCKYSIKPTSSRACDAILKSQGDKREYRGLQLGNGLKALLVSDPSTDKSAASINVRVGSMSDPRDLPGLAHFCEHMLFLGTQKYPRENEYSNFLSLNGGRSNAYTSLDNTNYFFNVEPSLLKEALDRFSQFFLQPLFTESAVDREINAIHSEHEKNLMNDAWRINQLEKSTSDPVHDYNKFSTGNRTTLGLVPKSKGIDVRQELIAFHKKWYSANLMSLAVLGKESLDELTEMVEPLFSQVENKGVEAPSWPIHPFGQEQLGKQTLAVPINDIRNLKLTFPLPDWQHHYRSNPGNYLGHLIGHEGPGSLLAELKSRGWVNYLTGGYSDGASGFAFFHVRTDLTDEGMAHKDEIVRMVMQYVEMLRREGPQEYVFKECQELAAIGFRFKGKEDPMNYVSYLADATQHYPMEEVLCGDFLLHEFRGDLIQEMLSKITPDNLKISVIGKSLAPLADTKEQWYQTEYNLSPIPEQTLDSWKQCGVSDTFKLPKKNEFIPSSFELALREQDNPLYPAIIENTEKTRAWFKQDDTFLLPKAYFVVEFKSPLLYATPLHFGTLRLASMLFEDALSEYSYDAGLAGLTYSLDSIKNGLMLNLGGYNNSLLILLRKIMSTLNNLQIAPNRFEILKELYVRSLNNFNAAESRHHCDYYTSVVLSEKFWSIEEMIESVQELKLEHIHQLIPLIFSRMHIEALAYGNLTRAEGLELVREVERGLSSNWKPLFESQMHRERHLRLEDGSSHVLEKVNSVQPTSAVQAYFQCGLRDTRTNALVDLFCQIIREPCFDVLRTKEQLGYIVMSGARRASGVIGVQIIVQSDREPSHVDHRIEAFLQSVEESLRSMTQAEFENHKNALASLKLEKPKNLGNAVNRYWSEIGSGLYHFDRANVEVEFMKTITKEDLMEFYKTTIAAGGPRRKKLSVHVSPELGTPQEETPVNTKKISNIQDFKASLGFYPLPSPHIDVTPKKLLPLEQLV